MDELACPRCRMTKYRNPALRLKINTCGHALCEGCVQLVFTRESAPCPECGRSLKKSGFRNQMFEDTRVDKEVDIRKGIMKIYNKMESDFKSLKDYNDYLEEVENIIWSLETGVNEKETREAIVQYRQENEMIIRQNQIKINKDKAHLKEIISNHNMEKTKHAELAKQMEKEADLTRRRANENLINGVSNQSDIDISNHKNTFDESSSTNNIDDDDFMEEQTNLQSIPDIMYQYNRFEINIFGPTIPSENDITSQGYVKQVRDSTPRDLGGGYVNATACSRALHDAFGGLLFSPSSTAANVL